jgi:hypothetical protein
VFYGNPVDIIAIGADTALKASRSEINREEGAGVAPSGCAVSLNNTSTRRECGVSARKPKQFIMNLKPDDE